MKGLFIPEITAEMFRNGCLESIEALMTEGEIYDIEYSPWIPVSEGLPPIGDEVIVTTVWGEVTKAERYGSGNEDWFIHEGATNAKTEDILAWIPNLQPYKEEQDGKNNTDND